MKRKVFREILILILSFALGFGLSFVIDTVLLPRRLVFADEPLVLLRGGGKILHYDYERGVWTNCDFDAFCDLYDAASNEFSGSGWYTAIPDVPAAKKGVQ